ncbi:hypothetical protein ACIRLA_46555 [Streptomyces sp. NPDC102364]|uniref:hypothetical protein n=1 Tax=Streptomyces sp. NPDC102364 TaxID=3366161 RepID=UPI00381BDB21
MSGPGEPDAYEARTLRDALAALGLFVAPMLPGEEKADGRPVRDHFLLYLALLKARVDRTVEMNTVTEADRADFERMWKVARSAEAGNEEGPSREW